MPQTPPHEPHVVQLDGVLLLELAGSPYARGWQHGTALGDRVRHLRGRLINDIVFGKGPAMGAGFLTILYGILARMHPNIPRELREEMRGLAAGARVRGGQQAHRRTMGPRVSLLPRAGLGGRGAAGRVPDRLLRGQRPGRSRARAPACGADPGAARRRPDRRSGHLGSRARCRLRRPAPGHPAVLHRRGQRAGGPQTGAPAAARGAVGIRDRGRGRPRRARSAFGRPGR